MHGAHRRADDMDAKSRRAMLHAARDTPVSAREANTLVRREANQRAKRAIARLPASRNARFAEENYW